MEKDYRPEVIRRVQELMLGAPEVDAKTVTNILITVLNDYDVQKRETELIAYDNINEALLKRWAACMTVEGKQVRTIKAYVRMLKQLADIVGSPYTVMKTQDLRYYFSVRLSQGVSHRTVETERAYCSSFFKWLLAEEVIEKDPCAPIKRIKYQETEKHPFSDVEIDVLRTACKNTKHRAIIEFLLASGVRVNELHNLTLFDVDIKSKTVRVINGKGGKDRTTYINDVAAHYLEIYLREREETGSALFYGNKGEPISSNGIWRVLNDLGETASVDHVHPHRFRRTLATKLAERGMPIQEIQQILGHKNINTTRGYICMDKTQIETSYRRHIA